MKRNGPFSIKTAIITTLVMVVWYFLMWEERMPFGVWIIPGWFLSSFIVMLVDEFIKWLSGKQWATYSEYLASDTWAAIRVPILNRACGHCEWCGRPGRLQIHHLFYTSWGTETPEQLVALCGACHKSAHRGL